tara:strand:- start:3160 stop:3420 length:261 start_codon:yes stop_codon:yes gene_type:complete
MKAIGKYIVIRPIKEDNAKTKGGLILAESHRTDLRYKRAEVINPGTDVNVLKESDKIFYDKAAGFNIEIDNEQYKVIKESDVVIIL